MQSEGEDNRDRDRPGPRSGRVGFQEERQVNGSPQQPLPSWITPWVAVVTQVGVPTVFAGVLLWFVLTKVGGAVDVIAAGESARTKILLDTQMSFLAALEAQTTRFEKAIDKNIEANREIIRQHLEATQRHP